MAWLEIVVGYYSARVQESGFFKMGDILGAFHWISHFLECIANLSTLALVTIGFTHTMKRPSERDTKRCVQTS
jgi:hypothetical protein